MHKERPYYEHADTRSHIRHWVLGQMLSGAGKAALFVFGLGLALYALYLVSLLLPPESKLAPSPQLGALEAPLVAVQVA